MIMEGITMDLKGKRLLILGGTTLLINVIKIAKCMGIYTLVTDMSPESPAKIYADKAFNISTSDINALLVLAKAEQVDGVFTGYDDFNTIIAQELCERLDLPFYATKEQLEVTKDKATFKELCNKFDIPTVKEYFATNDNNITGDINFPVVTKPADSYSGKGIRICNNIDELKDGIKFALDFSTTKKYLIEKFMSSNLSDCVNIDYVFSDGDILLSAVGDKYVNSEQGNHTPLTSAVIYPSKHQKEYIETLNDKVCKMFNFIGIRNGTAFIESFYDEKGFHFYEMGLRVGGGQSSIILSKMDRPDYVEMLIRFALTGTMNKENEELNISPNFDQVACGLVVLIKPGMIKEIIGIDEVDRINDVISITQYYHEGDEIKSNSIGTLGQTFARIHIISHNLESLNEVIMRIKLLLSVKDVDDNNLLLNIQIVEE